MSGSGRDKHDGPLASVHALDPDRPKRRRSLPKAPAAPNQETPAPDRNAALSMLGTFDLDDVDVRSPDEILATLAPESTVSAPGVPPQVSPADERAVTRDGPAVDDVQSDEILRELEEHHQRGQTTARPSAPRGSAELQPALRRQARPTRKRTVRGQARGESKPRGRRKRVALSVAVAAVFTATAMAVTLSQLGGKSVPPPTPIRSGRLAATTAFTLAPSKFLAAAANAIANEGRELTRRVKSPVRHHRRVAARPEALDSAPLGYPCERGARRLDVARDFQPVVQQLELDGCVKLSARDQHGCCGDKQQYVAPKPTCLRPERQPGSRQRRLWHPIRRHTSSAQDPDVHPPQRHRSARLVRRARRHVLRRAQPSRRQRRHEAAAQRSGYEPKDREGRRHRSKPGSKSIAGTYRGLGADNVPEARDLLTSACASVSVRSPRGVFRGSPGAGRLPQNCVVFADPVECPYGARTGDRGDGRTGRSRERNSSCSSRHLIERRQRP